MGFPSVTTATISLATPYPFELQVGGRGLVNLVAQTCVAGMWPCDKNAITIVFTHNKNDP